MGRATFRRPDGEPQEQLTLTSANEESIESCKNKRARNRVQREHAEHEATAGEDKGYHDVEDAELGDKEVGYHTSNCASKVQDDKL